MDKKYQAIVLAAMLHDVGKFYQKGGDQSLIDTTGKHPLISYKFIRYFKDIFERVCDVDLLEELVKRHHENENAFDKELLVQYAPDEYKPFALMVSTADNLSSMERDEGGDKTDFRARPLDSIFSSVSLENTKEPVTARYHPKVFSPENCFPDQKLASNVTSKTSLFVKDFEDEMLMLRHTKSSDFNVVYNVIHSLILKYFWCIPSSSYDKVADVSLYDHLKTTSAIVASLYRFHEALGDFSQKRIKDNKTRKFKLLAGDFSGIQKFIFDISAGEGGIAKRLRARSFYVNALLDILSHSLCHKFDLPLTNIIMSSGGKFYILLPNTAESNQILNDIKVEMESFLYKESNGEISVNLAWVDANGDELKNFDQLLYSLNQELNEVKQHRFLSVLTENDGWKEDKFEIFSDLEGKKLCNSCKKAFIAENSVKMCSRCEGDLSLGRRLANAKYIYFGKGSNGIPMFKDYSILVEEKPISTDAYLTVILNGIDLKEFYNQPVCIKYMANHIPLYSDEMCSDCKREGQCEGNTPMNPATFECIAGQATGRKLLGVFKADVDNLALLFVEGLKKDDGNHRYTVSRVTTLSRMLDMFFSGYLNQLIKEEHPNTYCVFSGGDDLFLLGPWDDTVNLSINLNKAFASYTGNNPSFTLTGALVPTKPKMPFTKAAEDAEHLLEIGKKEIGGYYQYLNAEVHNERINSKNQIVFMGENIKWDDFEIIIEEGEYLDSMLIKKIANKSQLKRLIDYGRMYREFRKDQTIQSLRFFPMLSYDINRNYKTGNNIDGNKFCDWVKMLRNNTMENKKLYFMSIIAGYAIMKNEEEFEHG